MPSRRDALGLMGAGAAAALAGCSSLPVGGDPTPTPVGTTTVGEGDPSAFEAYLAGPEETVLLFDRADVQSVGPVERGQGGAPGFVITLTEGGTDDVAETVRSAGVADDPDAYEVVLRRHGEEVTRFGFAPSLVEEIESGEWDGRAWLTFEDEERAQRVRETLVSGGA